MYEKIMAYQKKDIEIMKLKNQINSSDEKKTMSEMQNNFRSLQKQSELIAYDAEKQVIAFSEIEKRILELEKQIVDAEKTCNSDNEDENNATIQKLINTVSQLQKSLSILKNNADKINNSFNQAKREVAICKKNYATAKSKLENKQGSSIPKIEVLKQEMEELEKQIDPNLLEEYKKFKADNIIPVYVHLVDEACCGGCRQKLAINNLEKFKTENRLICENCRRIIIE